MFPEDNSALLVFTVVMRMKNKNNAVIILSALLILTLLVSKAILNSSLHYYHKNFLEKLLVILRTRNAKLNLIPRSTSLRLPSSNSATRTRKRKNLKMSNKLNLLKTFLKLR